MPAEAVRVCVRVRPLSKQELIDKRNIIVTMEQKMGQVRVAKPAGAGRGDDLKTFTFDR
jgi:hypothetical protein